MGHKAELKVLRTERFNLKNSLRTAEENLVPFQERYEAAKAVHAEAARFEQGLKNVVLTFNEAVADLRAAATEAAKADDEEIFFRAKAEVGVLRPRKVEAEQILPQADRAQRRCYAIMRQEEGEFVFHRGSVIRLRNELRFVQEKIDALKAKRRSAALESVEDNACSDDFDVQLANAKRFIASRHANGRASCKA